METLRKPEHIRRWVLALGDEARQVCEDVKLSAEELEMNEALAALYDSPEGRGGLRGGSGASSPRVARWLGDIRKYFPSSVVQTMQRDAFDRLNLRICCFNRKCWRPFSRTCIWFRP